MVSKTKQEQIFIGNDDIVVELLGDAKAEFIAEREKINAEIEAQKAHREAQKQLKISAYKKLGLTDEEIQAIL